MTFVVDASVCLAWCFEDEDAARAETYLEALAEADAIAPAVWPFEIANGLRSAERRGRISERDSIQATKLLTALPITVEELPLQRALEEVLPLARAVAVSAYDAAYLELALRRGLPLATVDDGLARAAVAAGAGLL